MHGSLLLSIGQEEAVEEALCEFDFGVQEVPFQWPPMAR
jgi:hypothetical protein